MKSGWCMRPLYFAAMRIVTLNANGIRSAARKGLFDWLPQQDADVVCLQETKAQNDQLADAHFRPTGYHSYYFDATKKGYSGVALYSRIKPLEVITGFGSREFDAEGRYIEARFKDLSIVSVYLPSGSSSEERQRAKFRFMAEFMPYLRSLRRKRRNFILCGDWNIAHKQIDLRNWRSNQKNSGFLPEERAWLDELFGDVRYVDAFRETKPRSRPVHLVVQSGPGLGEECRLADRLPGTESAPQGQCPRGRHPQDAALLRPRAAHHRLRLVSASGNPGQAATLPPEPWWRGWGRPSPNTGARAFSPCSFSASRPGCRSCSSSRPCRPGSSWTASTARPSASCPGSGSSTRSSSFGHR